MKFNETALAGVFILSLEHRRDERGFFARAFCTAEFTAHGILMTIVQSNVSVTRQRGTVRGMHFQVDPASEAKLVRCTRGAILDVAADLRPGSATYGQWVGVELTEDKGDALYIPAGCAHGFQTLTDDAAILYDTSAPYTPAATRGVRYDDPLLDIRWPLPVCMISQQDCAWPLLDAGSLAKPRRNP